MIEIPTQNVCLVTGGAGFIGSHLVERLVARGDHVIIIDNLSTGCLHNLDGIDANRITVLQTTVTEGLAELKPGACHEIYHLAAAVGVRLVIEKPVHTIETNVHETMAVLRYATESLTPILIASTSEVYGKSTRIPFAEDDDVVYGPTIYPRWSYACSKAIDEFLALAYHREDGLPVTIPRFFNTVGPRQVGGYGMVLPRFVERALAGQPLEVHGDGEQTRCFCDVRDVVDLLPALLSHPKASGQVFNVGHDQPIGIRDLATLVCRTLNSKSEIQTIPYEEVFGADFDDLRNRQPDLSRLRALTGFQSTIPLTQTILDLAASLSKSNAAQTEASG